MVEFDTSDAIKVELLRKFKRLPRSVQDAHMRSFAYRILKRQWDTAMSRSDIMKRDDFIGYLEQIFGITGGQFAKEVSPLENLSFNLNFENLAILGIGLGGIYFGPKKGTLSIPAKLIGYGGTALGITSILGLFTLGDLRRTIGI